MRFAFFPGCVSRGGCPELYQSTTAIAPLLDLDLEELTSAACTGAGVISERNPELADTLNARTFALAEGLGLPLLTQCSTCQGVMSKANYKLRRDSAYLQRINNLLAPEGYTYQGTTRIKHLLWYVVEDFGLDRLRGLVKRPLGGLRVAPFYGCYILRPTSILADPEYPERDQYLEQLTLALGGHPVDYSGKDKCCGFPILTMNKTNSLRMAGDHLAEAKDKGADLMVTPCPLCHLNLDGQQPDAARVTGRQLNLPILHLPQLIGLALGLNERALGLSRHITSTKPILAQVKT